MKKISKLASQKTPRQFQDGKVYDFGLSLSYPKLVLGSGITLETTKLISDLGFAFEEIIFISDEKIWRNCEKLFPENFTQKVGKFLLLKNPQADEKNLKKISAALKNYKLIIGLGSGVINDLCKFTSAQKNIPYAIFASAASMNGYLSKNASITILGHKKTLSATLPLRVFCDLKILSQAPLELTKAGIGDSLCFYSCWFDWYLSHKILGTKFNKKPFEILAPKMEFFVKNYKKFSPKDEKFLHILIEILMLSGLGMTMSGGSYPASQSEHMIAHTIEMKYPKKAEKILHGQMIAVTSLTSSKIQKLFLANHANIEESSFFPREKLEKFFGKEISAACKKEYEEKISAYKKAKKISAKTKKELQKIYFSEEKLRAIFSHFKIKYSSRSLGLSDQQYQACVAYAKFTRNRFTCLDLSTHK